MTGAPSPGSALLVVDVQNGFIAEPDQLPVAGGAEVIPIVNAILPRFAIRVATQDWHPPDHGSFASAHPGTKPFERGMLGGVPQIFWPDHCVQGTRGAELHPALHQAAFQAVIRKGYDRSIDSYSAFSDNARKNPTGLDGYLLARGAERIFIAGLTLDYCVRFSSLDARRLLPEARICVVLDATRPVDAATGAEAVEEMRRAGVRLIRAAELPLRP